MTRIHRPLERKCRSKGRIGLVILAKFKAGEINDWEGLQLVRLSNPLVLDVINHKIPIKQAIAMHKALKEKERQDNLSSVQAGGHHG